MNAMSELYAANIDTICDTIIEDLSCGLTVALAACDGIGEAMSCFPLNGDTMEDVLDELRVRLELGETAGVAADDFAWAIDDMESIAAIVEYTAMYHRSHAMTATHSG